MSVLLDLGAGQRPREGYEPVDLFTGPKRIDLLNGERWPWRDSSVDAIYSSHFIEHIPADEVDTHVYDGIACRLVKQDRLFWFFDECYRILKPGALIELAWPALQHPNAFRDPTHRRFLPLEFTYYLSKKSRESMGVSHYNVECDFETKEARLRFDRWPGVEGEDDNSSRPWTKTELRTAWGAVMEYQATLITIKE